MNRNAVPADLPAGSHTQVPDVAALPSAIASADRVLATVLELTSSVVRVVDVSGRIVRTNEPVLAGRDALPATLRALWERDKPQRAQDTSPLAFLDTPGMRALGGITTRAERLAIREAWSGEVVVKECNATPLLSDNGRVIGAIIVDQPGAEPVRDPSIARQEAADVPDTQPPLPSSNEPEHADRSASALIHDVNNALNTIMAAAFLAQHRADSPDAIRDYAGRIQQAAESGAKAAALVERMVREASKPAASAPNRESAKSFSGDVSTKAGPLDILLVEDNPDGREFIGRLLRTAGHRVDAVATVAEARTRLDHASSAAVDLLLTDLDLPDGNGWELAAYARGQRSSLRVGVISGWDVNIGGEEAADAEFVLRKPLRAAALLDHVAGRHARALPE